MTKNRTDIKTNLKARIDQALGRVDADLVIRAVRMLNVATGEVERTDIAICGDKIVGTYDDNYRGRREIDGSDLFAVPGFIDTHVHPESSLVQPGEFDRLALSRGTTTAIADPHEISNVLGIAGLRYFLEAAEGTAMDLRINLSSCVPASALETSGARLDADDLVSLRDHPKVIGLAEFMNFPGVLAKDEAVLDKLAAFDGWHIDGHSPLLGGRPLNAYLACGVRNCHEVTHRDEALEKIRKGMQVLIRDGSVTRDVEALADLIDMTRSPFLAFCTDDRTPLHIAEDGHIDYLIRTAIAKGAPMAATYRTATWSAARGFGLTDRGLLAPGYLADIVLLSDLESCQVAGVIKSGRPVDAETFAGRRLPAPIGYGSIKRAPVDAALFRTPCAGPTGPVIGLVPQKIITEALVLSLPYTGGERHADPGQDVLKVAVLERHGHNGNVGRGFVKGFGITDGAIASSFGHDAHNIIVVGTNDEDMALAVNRLIELQGGFVAVVGGQVRQDLPLPIAGLMSDWPAEDVERRLHALREQLRAMGCHLDEPFVQLAFLPLSMIPHLKITDRGLVDADHHHLITLDGDRVTVG
ncbi:adenine deaminase [Telmatospirillum sp.]|uniref:adenine deaminase n=1 Tax=Telmatospirillum sp. TaxID=2079197 RepID=UPI00285013A0|nr:adenine deaminase [Telmatospirillum sp.]MDR3434996.1 adenine deaminase [Telmatospirillum sp.]